MLKNEGGAVSVISSTVGEAVTVGMSVGVSVIDNGGAARIQK